MLPPFVGATLRFHYRDAGAGPKLADCRRKIDVLVLHDEPKNAPAHATAETMKCLALRADMERRGLLLMERAKRLKICARSP